MPLHLSQRKGLDISNHLTNPQVDAAEMPRSSIGPLCKCELTSRHRGILLRG